MNTTMKTKEDKTQKELNMDQLEIVSGGAGRKDNSGLIHLAEIIVHLFN